MKIKKLLFSYPPLIIAVTYILIAAGRLYALEDQKQLIFSIPPIIAALSSSAPLPPMVPTVDGKGRITFTVSFGDSHHQVYRIKAEASSGPEDISSALNVLSPVATPFDRSLNCSPDGEWLVLETNRFAEECLNWPCLALVKGDLSEGKAITADGSLIHVGGWGAVSSTGNFIVFTGEGTHPLDLWSITRPDSKSAWNRPVNLTAASPYPFNQWPSLSADGSSIVFKCGQDSYDQASICEVNSDGTGLRVTIPAGNVNGSSFLNSPDYAPDGSIVFEEAEFDEQIWRMPAGGAAAINISGQAHNDNSPCVLPDGRIVSQLYRNMHELKVMDPDGRNPLMLFEGVDLADIGMGCGE